jgi:hypothetical protein
MATYFIKNDGGVTVPLTCFDTKMFINRFTNVSFQQ